MKILQRILIVDGYSLIEAGLRTLVAGEPDIEVLAWSDETGAAASAVGKIKPDLLLLDRTMPGMNNAAAMAQIRRRYPDARLLVIVPHREEDFVRANLSAGADGCIRQDAAHAEYLEAIRSVLRGNRYLNPSAALAAANSNAGGGSPGAGSAHAALTPRELDVLKLVAAGKSSRCIAKLLGLSVKTVGKHRANLMAKLDLHNAAALTAYAIASGLN